MKHKHPIGTIAGIKGRSDMKQYLAPTLAELSCEAVDVITASGDGIVSAVDQSQASQTMESEWKDTWN